MEYQVVTWEQFITVMIGIVALIATITSIVYGKISSISERLAVAEKQNEADDNNFKVLYEKVDSLSKDRVNDKIIYNEAINKLNMTLSKIEVALENNNIIVRELKEQLNRKS